MTETEVKVYLT